MNADELIEPPLLLTRRQTAAVLGLCERTVDALRKRGELPAITVGRAIRFDRRDVLAWIDRAKVATVVPCAADTLQTTSAAPSHARKKAA